MIEQTSRSYERHEWDRCSVTASPGWLDWIATLSASPEEVCLDLRGIGADDPESTRLATSPPGLTLLTSQCQWVEWSCHADGLGHRLVVELSEVSSLPAQAILVRHQFTSFNSWLRSLLMSQSCGCCLVIYPASPASPLHLYSFKLRCASS